MALTPYSFIRKDKDPDNIIPESSPWYFRWGIQGFITIYYYCRYVRAMQHKDNKSLSNHEKKIHEKLNSSIFSCTYGRPGDTNFRGFIRYAEEQNIAKHHELVSIIRSGELKSSDSHNIQIKPSYPVIFVAIYFYLSLLVSDIGLSLLWLSYPISLSDTISGLAIINFIHLYFFTSFYKIAFKPFFIARRLQSDISHLIRKYINLNKKANLSLVK